ncbi:serine hydrolase [Aliikangiella marina]|uniref:Serine hydrolase n=2 Tax=Aliikangiella marina TaxID=1712262 RepID=A0A545TEK1_9GAMM|nr:serine hydrolase [Aliikangiella marina]
MQGFPPPPDKLIMQPESNYFSFPKLRWTVCHIRELLPTKNISKGLSGPTLFTYQLDKNIDSLTFKPINSNKDMTWKESLDANYTDGILIIHKGKIIYEKQSGCLNEFGKHAAMSMTKSVVGLLAEILIAEERLNENELVKNIIPELSASGFGNATVRQVMDMTTNLTYSEDYSDPKADIWTYSIAASPLPKPKGYDGPVGYYEYLQTVKSSGKHGDAFGYRTINTDVLGWIVARVAKQSIADLFSNKIWQKIGAEQDAYITVDSKGVPFSGGGLSAGLRDLGRFGLMVLNKGNLNGNQIIPAAAVENIMRGGDKAAFEKAGYSTLAGGSYKSMWWLFHNDSKAFAARGVYGQTIYIDPEAEMVLVRFASYPTAKNAKIDPTSLPAYEALSQYLRSGR